MSEPEPAPATAASLAAWSWWGALGRPALAVAPMVDASELAWRALCRRHGATLCYTPMLHSSVFVKHPRYRQVSLASCPGDRPLIVQFCGNDPAVLLEAARLALEEANGAFDAIDLNLGCPQAIARRGRYGSFLQDEWPLLQDIVRTLSEGAGVPITCKVRVFESVERTVAYARMLEAAGCMALTVHGRTREQRGPLTGLASWSHIKAVRENVSIPVIANGNIQCMADVARCLEETGCAAVMTAEGNLHNPCLFEGGRGEPPPPVWRVATEYLDLVALYPCPTSYARGHLFKIFHSCLSLPENHGLREKLAKGPNPEDFREVVDKLKLKYEPIHNGELLWTKEYAGYNLELPPWLCQPYVRPPPEEYLRKQEENQDGVKDKNENVEMEVDAANRVKRKCSPEVSLSKNKLKKLHKRQSENPHSRRVFEKCAECPNPMGLKCEYSLCKACCKSKCYTENRDCAGHRILTATRREQARERDTNNAIACR